MSLRLWFAVVCFALAAIPGCAKETMGTPTGPTPAPTPSDSSFSGQWDGSVVFEKVWEMDGLTLTSAVTLTVQEVDGSVTGTWRWRRRDGNTWTREPITGTRTGETLTLILPLGQCTATATGATSNRVVTLRSDGFVGWDLCKTSTVTLSLTKQ